MEKTIKKLDDEVKNEFKKFAKVLTRVVGRKY